MNIVRETREHFKLSQKEMAKLLGRSQRTVAGWEALDVIDDEVVILACERLKNSWSTEQVRRHIEDLFL